MLIYLHLQKNRVKISSTYSIRWHSVECLFTIFPLLSTEVDWRVQAVRHRPGWLDPGFIWTVSIHGLQYSITHHGSPQKSTTGHNCAKATGTSRMSAMVDTTRFSLNWIFSPCWAVSHKFIKLIQENFQDKEPSLFWGCNPPQMIVFVWRYNYNAWCVKKNLVVFCSMTNLSYVCWGWGILWTHPVSLSVSLSVIVDKLFNVLTLIDTIKKRSTLLRVKWCIVNMI